MSDGDVARASDEFAYSVMGAGDLPLRERIDRVNG
jgi:hypothetical protein